MKQDHERVQLDNTKLLNTNYELSQQCDADREAAAKQRIEIKELKLRENRLLNENTDLEDDNVQLQQQMAKLRHNLIEFDTIKHENKALQETLEYLHSQIDELQSLKRIGEKQLEEALNSLREEREHKHQIKRELDQRLQRDQLQSLKNFAGLAGVRPTFDYEDDEDEASQLAAIEQASPSDEQQHMGSLFNEVHTNEIKKLEEGIAELSKHKEALEAELHEFKTDLGEIHVSVDALNRKIAAILDGEVVQPDAGAFGKDGKVNKVIVGELKRLLSELSSLEVKIARGDANAARELKIGALGDDIDHLVHVICTSTGLNANKVSVTTPTSSDDSLDILADKVKLVRVTFEKGIDAFKQKLGENSNDMSNDAHELQDQIIKLKSLLSTKREQIATLRTVLKANKQTAEVALANLKSKYENEKLVVTETMQKLRNELKTLKEDAATFATLRAMFTARCDEYVTQIDELQRQLSAAEEERKTLNSLLRLAIQQKLTLTQRLEDIEMDNERVVQRAALSNSASNLSLSDAANKVASRSPTHENAAGEAASRGDAASPSAFQRLHKKYAGSKASTPTTPTSNFSH